MPAIRYALVVTAVWLIATGTYFAFRDDVLTRLIGEQTELQSVYEDHIAKLHAQFDRKPLIGEINMTSPFGMRMHPLLGRLAIHTGIDLRGDVGVPVRAMATGKVTIAGRQGGYGNMVEISHGNGLATRFGHLSEISVKIGQVVRIGELVGRIGSTGRSTGPHLHYETRVNGEAVDPQKFLHAGLTLDDSLDATALPLGQSASQTLIRTAHRSSLN